MVVLRSMVVLVLSLLGLVQGYGQSSATFIAGKWGIEADYLLGNIIKHSKKINHVPTELTQGFEVSYFKRTLGEKPWHRPLNYPEVGGSFGYFHFGENPIFGDAYSFLAFSKFYLVRSKVVNLYTRIGGGFGFLTKHYDFVTNPTNNIVSSTVNIAVQVRIGMDWKITKYLQLGTAFSFNHFSNAAANLPNYGINVMTGTIGLKVYPQPRDAHYDCHKTKDFKKNEFIWKYSLGIQEIYGFNGPKFPVHVGTLCYARYTSPANKLYAGLSFEYFRSIHDWLTYNEIPTKHGATFESSIASVVLGDEIVLGRIGMFYGGGIYLWKSYATPSPFYFKVGANVYFAQMGKRKGFKFFGGTNVKSHTSVAQYWEFSLGGTM